jgi:hypothetical protein
MLFEKITQNVQNRRKTMKKSVLNCVGVLRSMNAPDESHSQNEFKGLLIHPFQSG